VTWRSYFNSVIGHEVKFIALLVFACLLVSTTGLPFNWLLLIALCCYVGYHLYQGKIILEWLSEHKSSSPPDEIRGIWSLIAQQVHQKNKYHKNKDNRNKKLIGQFTKVSQAIPDGIIILDSQGRIEWFNDPAIKLLGLRKQQDRGVQILQLLRDPGFVKYFQSHDRDKELRMDSPISNKLNFTTSSWSLFRTSALYATWNKSVRILWLMFHMSCEHHSVSLWATSKLYRKKSLTSLRLINPEILRDANILSGSKNQTITLDADPSLWILGNTREIHGAFSNLVANAVNYTPEGGKIDIRWYREDDQLVMSVKDTGAGIDALHIDRITERFYRVDRGRSRSTGGTGLGLAIVKHALQRHDAALEIQSAVGEGSTFSCVFPLERGLANNNTKS